MSNLSHEIDALKDEDSRNHHGEDFFSEPENINDLWWNITWTEQRRCFIQHNVQFHHFSISGVRSGSVSKVQGSDWKNIWLESAWLLDKFLIWKKWTYLETYLSSHDPSKATTMRQMTKIQIPAKNRTERRSSSRTVHNWNISLWFYFWRQSEL